MSSAEVMMVGGGLVLAGLAAENFVAHRWLVDGGRARVGVMAVLAVLLPASGLAFIAMLAA